MQAIYKYFLLFLLLVGSQTAFAQLTLKKAADIKVDPAINSEELQQIIKTTEKTLNEYADAVKMLDKEQSLVTEMSVDRFNKLFVPGAKIDRDFIEYFQEDLIDYKNYSLEVVNRLEDKGVEVTILEMELKEVRADGDEFYVPIVEVKKERYSAVSSNGSVKILNHGEVFKQQFKLDIIKKYPDKASIAQIAHILEGKKSPGKKAGKSTTTSGYTDDYTRIISIPVGIGWSRYNASMSDYWNTAHTESNLGGINGLNYSVGVEIMSDKLITSKESEDRKLAMSIGLQYAGYSMNTSLEGFKVQEFEVTAESSLEPDSIQRYIRSTGPVYVTEKLNFNTIGLPIGIGYRLLNKPRTQIYAKLKFVPSYVFGVNGTLKGTGRYDGVLIDEATGEISRFRILEMMATSDVLVDVPSGFGAYKVGESMIIDTDAKPEIAKFSLELQLSPTAYFSFSDDNPGTGLLVGVDVAYRLGSLIKHNPISSTLENPLKYNEGDFAQGSLMNYFADNMSALNIGLRIGIFRKLSIDP